MKKKQTLSPEERQQSEKWRLERLKALVLFATLGIRSIIIINGSAVAILMALLGSLWSGQSEESIMLAVALKPALVYFVYGLVSGVIVVTLAYIGQISFTQHQNEDNWPQKLGAFARATALFLAAVSLTFFFLGAIKALEAFS